MSQKSTSNSKILSRLKEKVKEVEKEKLYWFEHWQTVCVDRDRKDKALRAFQNMESGNKKFEELITSREINDLKEIIKALIQTFNPSDPAPSASVAKHIRGTGSNY